MKKESGQLSTNVMSDVQKTFKNNLFYKIVFWGGFWSFSLYIPIQLAQIFRNWFSSTPLQILICNVIGV